MHAPPSTASMAAFRSLLVHDVPFVPNALFHFFYVSHGSIGASGVACRSTSTSVGILSTPELLKDVGVEERASS